MGKPSLTNPKRMSRWLVFLQTAVLALTLPIAAQTRATTVPLLLPSGMAFDAAGNLYLAEQTGHQVLEVSAVGVLTRFAGTGVQGFAGDGGPALAAQLDSPVAVALSPGGDLYIADAHNHRIRRVTMPTGAIATVAGTGQPGSAPDGSLASSSQLDLPVALAFSGAGDLFFADARTHQVRRIDHATGLLSTVAGSGVQGFSGDGGPALLAELDTPSGLAVDGAGAVLLADAHNGRIRRVDPGTHLITTIAGNGASTFSGDSAAATQAGLRLPRGLTIDSAGNLYFADSGDGRIRRVDAGTGVITTVAGGPVQSFAGDGSPAVQASLDSPRAVALTPTGLVTLSDSANARARQVDASAVIHTIAGLGETTGASLTLTAPSTISYGTGTLTATLAASPATGSVTLLETSGGQFTTLASVSLSSNTANFSMATLPAGTHQLLATYGGDDLHTPAQSQDFLLTVTPAPVVATPVAVAMLYGQTPPALSGSLAGVLPADSSMVSLLLASAATAQSPPAAYPIAGALSGAAAANYSLTTLPADVTISRAPVLIVLSTNNSFSAHVTSTTSGTPTGSVVLLDGSQFIASASLSAGYAVWTPTLAAGVHSLSAAYAGDTDFLPTNSAASSVTVSPGPVPDFSLSVAGQGTQTILAGSAASFTIAVALTNGGPPSAIQFSIAGLPVGATASFNPAYVPPGGAVMSSIVTIQTLHAALQRDSPGPLGPVLVLLLPLLLRRRSQARFRIALLGLSATMLIVCIGCGDRVSTSGQSAPIQTYNLVITGTATSAAGATLQHSASVTLKVQ